MGKVAAKYSRRVSAVQGATRQLRQDSKTVLVQGLQEVHDDQLTNVTTLPITGRMRRSIGGRVTGQAVEVGYNIGHGQKAPYAPARLNMKGISKTGRHRLDMDPAPALRSKTRARLEQLRRKAQRSIIGD